MATKQAGTTGSGIPRIVAGLLALVALGASILADADPVQTVIRGAVAFVIGNVIGSIIVFLLNQPPAAVQLEVIEGKSVEESRIPEEERAAS